MILIFFSDRQTVGILILVIGTSFTADIRLIILFSYKSMLNETEFCLNNLPLHTEISEWDHDYLRRKYTFILHIVWIQGRCCQLQRSPNDKRNMFHFKIRVSVPE